MNSSFILGEKKQPIPKNKKEKDEKKVNNVSPSIR